MTTGDWPPRLAGDYLREASRRLDDGQLDAFKQVQAIILDCDGILTGGELIYGPRGEALKAFHARDGLGLVMARSAGLRLALLTGRDSAIAARRAEELRFDAVKLGRFDKQRAMAEIMQDFTLPPAQILYMGDDLIDIPALDLVGLPITVPEAPDDVRARCRYVTEAAGGAGAVREVIDLVLMSQGLLGDALVRMAETAWLPGEENQ